MTKMYVPNDLHEQAKKLQEEYKKKGFHRPLYACLQQIQSGAAGSAPTLEDIRRVVKDAVKDSRRGGSGGGWLG